MRRSSSFCENNNERKDRGTATGLDRLDATLQVLSKHTCDAVAELKLSLDELRHGADFLAKVGHMSDNSRHEMILLSDILGVSALIETLNDDATGGSTPTTLLDPFYTPNAPARQNADDIRLQKTGALLDVEMSVTNLRGDPVPAARVEVWHANSEGLYDIQCPNSVPEHNLRGVFTADAEGKFSFRSERPGAVAVPTDGPAGDLLKALGRSCITPAHLCFRVVAPGYKTLFTQIFDEDDPDLKHDTVFAAKHDLAVPFISIEHGWRVQIRLVLSPYRQGDQ